ncbi:hypothetical protein CR513_47816, partial [Mucuna pruriens]
MRHLCKSIIKHQRVTIAIFVENLDISRRITQGIRLGLKIKRFLTIQTITSNEKFVFMGNIVKALVETVGSYHLILNTRHHLDWKLFILVSLSKLDVTGYSFNSGNGCFSLFKHNHLIGTDILCDGLYKLNLNDLYAETFLTLHHNVGTKLSLVNEHYAFSWQKCLGKTKHTKKGATRSTQLLKIVHAVNSFGKERYFITFIDDHSRYGYVYLLHEKSQAVDALEIYLNELDRKVKVVRFDRGDEYYKRYDENGQHTSPFAKLL